MSIHKIQSEVIDVQGIYTLAVYVHYFLPGSLKIQSKVYTVPLGQLRELIDNPVPDPLLFLNTRRWLPKGEAPYPGYCRAPGSAQCLPALCNCKKLQEVWNSVVLLNHKKKLEKKSVTIKQSENNDLKTKQTTRAKKKVTKINQAENKDLKIKGTKRTKKKGHKHAKQTKS